MQEIPYDRNAAVSYARKWALSRNPAYYNFEKIGEDCTNFTSHCLLAGSGIMNYTPLSSLLSAPGFWWQPTQMTPWTDLWTPIFMKKQDFCILMASGCGKNPFCCIYI